MSKKDLFTDHWIAAVFLRGSLFVFGLFAGCRSAEVRTGDDIQQAPIPPTEQVTKAETNAAKAVEVKF